MTRGMRSIDHLKDDWSARCRAVRFVNTVVDGPQIVDMGSDGARAAWSGLR
jgi:hypothetical protein